MGFGNIIPYVTLAAALAVPGMLPAAAAWLAPYITTGIVVAGSMLSAALTEDVSPQLSAASLERGIKANTCSTQEDIKVVYGQRRVGGNTVFRGVSGDNNEILWIVDALGEGECEGIAQVDDVDQVFLNDKLYTEFGGNVEYWFHSGSATQTYDTNLHAAIPEWTDNMRYTTYIVWKLTYDRNYFQSVPSRQLVLKGRKLYDFRDVSTAYSNNPVLTKYDYQTNSRYGLSIAAAKFDTGAGGSWRAAADYCDTKSWVFNMAITGQQAQDILDTILAHFRGELVWWDGKYYLRFADLNEESSCMTLSDKHIAQDEETGKALISIGEPSAFDVPDGLSVLYVDPDKNYVTDTLQIGETTGFIQELKLLGASRQQAADLGVYFLERKQLGRTVTGTFRDDTVKLEPHDIVTLSTTALSISSQLMRVIEANIRENGLIDLTLLYEQTLLYDDDYNLDTEGTYQCSLPDPTDEPPSVGNVQKTEETYDYRLRTFTRLKITFDPPASYAWLSHIEVYLSYDDSNWTYLYDVNTDFNIDNVEEGKTYYIRLKVVSIWGTKQKDENDYKISHTVGGHTSAPASLGSLNAVVNANTINLYAQKVSDPDVELYEFRLGSAWSGGIFLAALRSPNLSLYGVKPGNHTFIANTLSNNALYGGTPRIAAAALKDPPDGWTVQATETCDYNGVGTHDNTEHTTYDSDDYLKCSHTGGVLTGTYKSPIYDRGSSGRYMIYLLADIVVTGTGTTWDDVIPDPDTWNELNIATRSWVEIFELLAGPSVQIKLLYGETSPPANEVEKLEILSCIVTARYFQVKIIITDPSDAVNALVEHFTLKFCQ